MLFAITRIAEYAMVAVLKWDREEHSDLDIRI